MKTIYILHEIHAESHYNALKALAAQKGYAVKFREFQWRFQLKQVLRGKENVFRLIRNLFFVWSLMLRSNLKIVLAIAPYNYRLLTLAPLLKKHQVYFHTSFTRWGGADVPHPTDSQVLKNFWRTYLHEVVKHVFAVSEKTRFELSWNSFVNKGKISVVNHSFDIEIPASQSNKKSNNYLYVGRLVEEKGIRELLKYFAQNNDLNLTLAGDGVLVEEVKNFAQEYQNIKYLGYINGLEKLIPIYQQHSFLILNSKRTSEWEELFGISLIEGMAAGCVPLATDHPGPKEIISDGVNGLICEEGMIAELIEKTKFFSQEEYEAMQKNAIERGQSFSSANMAQKWEKLFI